MIFVVVIRKSNLTNTASKFVVERTSRRVAKIAGAIVTKSMYGSSLQIQSPMPVLVFLGVGSRISPVCGVWQVGIKIIHPLTQDDPPPPGFLGIIPVFLETGGQKR